MSDDEADPELLALLHERLGLNVVQQGVSSDTGNITPPITEMMNMS